MTTTTATTATSPAKTNGNGAALAKPAHPMDLLKKDFETWRPTLRAILPRHIDPERVIKIAMNVYLNNPELQRCTPASMVRATLQAAELGLEPSPLLGEAYFLPFKNKKKVKDGNVLKDTEVQEVQLIPGYVGLVKLAKQTGDIADVYAVVVDESEKKPEFDRDGRVLAGFYVEEGTVRKIHHIRQTENRTGVLFAVYGVVKFKDGTCHYEVMSKGDVDAIRARSKAKDSGPWVTDYAAMAKKTAIKQALKTVPKSPEKPQLAQAIAADNSADDGRAFSTDLTGSIDAEGVDTTDAEPPAQEPTRTEALSAKLDQVPHDPVTGEVHESVAVKK
jgi:recombination protein RecT